MLFSTLQLFFGSFYRFDRRKELSKSRFSVSVSLQADASYLRLQAGNSQCKVVSKVSIFFFPSPFNLILNPRLVRHLTT